MTVYELIEVLVKFPPHKEVCIHNVNPDLEDGGFPCRIEEEGLEGVGPNHTPTLYFSGPMHKCPNCTEGGMRYDPIDRGWRCDCSYFVPEGGK